MRGHAALTTRHAAVALGMLAALELLVALASLSAGSSALVGPGDWLGWLTGSDPDARQHAVMFQARLPRTWLAGLVGAALGASGAAFQAMLRNPLADPYVLGVSGGAALAGTLFLAVGGSAMAGMGLPLASLGGAGATLLMLWAMQRRLPPGRTGAWAVLLIGVLFNAFASSLITLLKSIVSAQKAQELLFYLMGSLAAESMTTAELAVCTALIGISLAALIAQAPALNLLGLGDEDARALGVEPGRVRGWTIVSGSAAVAVAVAYSGLIGFVGLVVPHALRLVLGPDLRLLLPAAALGGAAYLTACDLAARMGFGLIGTTLPTGVISALVGAPLFALLLWRSLGRGLAEGQP
jgi:iron complex transport system permease protein